MPGTTDQPAGAITPNDTSSPKTIYDALVLQCRDIEEIKREYPTVTMLSTVLGVVPNTYQVGLLFRGAFTCASLVSRSMLDFPAILLSGGGSMSTAAIAGYAASERASCAYCKLHCCVLMKRFGAADTAWSADSRTPVEAASTAHGAALAARPNSVEAVVDAVKELRKHVSEKEVEIQASVVSILGFMNTFNSMIGVPSEMSMANAVEPQLKGAGKTISDDFTVDKPKADGCTGDAGEFSSGDTWGFVLKLLKSVPAAEFYTLRAMWGIPGGKNGARAFLVEHLGASLSLLEDAANDGVRRALVLALRDNLAGDDCKFPRALKYAAGLAFARATKNDLLAGNMQTLLAIEQQANAVMPEGLPETLLSVAKEAEGCGHEWCETVMGKLRAQKKLRERDVCTLMLCMTAFRQPIKTGAAITAAVHKELEGAEIVEIVSWVSLLAMMNRMMLSTAAGKSKHSA